MKFYRRRSNVPVRAFRYDGSYAHALDLCKLMGVDQGERMEVAKEIEVGALPMGLRTIHGGQIQLARGVVILLMDGEIFGMLGEAFDEAFEQVTIL